MHEIGRTLKEGRIAKNLDIVDIARTTRISGHYVRAMEEGRFHIIPKVFDKGYLKIYAGFLGMDTKSIMALYEEAQPEKKIQSPIETR